MSNDQARMTKMGVHYFYGEDTYAAREAIADLATKERAQIRFLEQDQLDERTLKEKLTSGGGMFGKDLMVIRDPSQLPKALQEVLVSVAEEKFGGDVVLWDQEEPREKSPVFAKFQGKAQVFGDLSFSELSAWLVQEAKKRGVILDAEIADLFLQRLGSDRWRLLSELERLSLVGGEITRERVEAEITAASSAGEIFELLRAVTAGKREQALKEFQALLESGASELYIVSMLAYQLRTLYLLSKGKTQGVSPGAARALMPVAKQRPAVAWLNDLTRVVATDFAIKQGKTDMRTGVTLLILGLLGISNPSSR